MRIHKLRIENFKGIQGREFSFESQFSVLIGDNATGKTTVLDALAIALGSFFLGIEEVGSRGIQPSEVRVIDVDGQPRPQKPVVIEALGEIDGVVVGPWRRELVTRNTTSAAARPISRIAQEKLARSRRPAGEQSQREVFPLIVYHGTGRLWAEHEKISYQRQIEGVVRGYANALTSKSSGKEFLAWVKTQEDSLNKFEDPLERAHLLAFKRAILSILPGERWHGIEWDFKNDALTGVFRDPDGQLHRLSYGQLSDGYRNLIGMVADIAYRCIQLNPHLREEAVTETPGVVLIDELDLHLHPNWQRTVVNDLKRTFPRLQFIATTHSPFIVQSLGDRELINLDRPETDPPPDELPLSVVVTEVMGVENVRSDNFEKRLDSARREFQKVKAGRGELTLDDYVAVSRAARDLLRGESNDPEYRAFLEESDDEDKSR